MFCSARVAEELPSLTESLEGVFALSRQHDVSDEPEEIALARSVGEITRRAQGSAKEFLALPHFGPELRLILLEHALVLAHVGNVPGAEVAKARVFRLFLVIFQRLEESLMLHDRVVYLAFEKV